MAHLYQENGALAEDRHGDWYAEGGYHCSLGMHQWNLCVHENHSVEYWLRENPEWAEWRFQIRHYLGEMDHRLKKYGNIDTAIASWNFGGHPWYLQKVKNNVRHVEKIYNDK